MRAASLVLLVASVLTGCATLPLPESGTAYRAVGTEPFWALELTGRKMVFTEAHAPGARIAEPQPKPIHGFAGDIYQGHRINLNIVRNTRCSDGMSDRVYPDRVQLRVDGRSFDGCGGEGLMPASLEDTNWSVESLNGRAIPRGERYFVRFKGAISASASLQQPVDPGPAGRRSPSHGRAGHVPNGLPGHARRG